MEKQGSAREMSSSGENMVGHCAVFDSADHRRDINEGVCKDIRRMVGRSSPEPMPRIGVRMPGHTVLGHTACRMGHGSGTMAVFWRKGAGRSENSCRKSVVRVIEHEIDHCLH